jgi:hypothetical protein
MLGDFIDVNILDRDAAHLQVNQRFNALFGISGIVLGGNQRRNDKVALLKCLFNILQRLPFKNRRAGYRLVQAFMADTLKSS